MREKPILFSGEMVRAILDGRKTQTRRVVKLDEKSVLSKQQIASGWKFSAEHARVDYPVLNMPRLGVPWKHPEDPPMDWSECACQILHTPFEVGTRLWVKETFAVLDKDAFEARRPAPYSLRYKADPETSKHLVFRPSIFLPRWASRITLEITGARCERLNSISESDAKAEGVEASRTVEMKDGSPCYSLPFQILWNQINGVDSWAANPWVWVVTFKKLSTPEAMPG